MNVKLAFSAILFAAVLTFAPAHGADVVLTFDGVTDSGWTISNQPVDPPVPFADVEGTGLSGIAFDDTVQGVAYYIAPPSLTGVDFTNGSLSFGFWVDNDFLGLADDNQFADLIVNGVPIALDILDEDQIDVLQAITIDFADPAFAGIDLSAISSLWIRSEFWTAGGEGIESYLVSVPEAKSSDLLLSAVVLFGLAVIIKR